MRASSFAAWMATGLIGSAVALAAPPEWRYQVRLELPGERLDVEVCAPPGQTVRLEALDPAATGYLIDIDPQHWTVQRDAQHMRWQGPGCAHYAVALGRIADAGRREHGYRVGDDLLVWPTAWLWWPRDRAARMRLQMQLPDTWNFSSAWPRPDPDAQIYTLGSWPRYWSTLTAFGPFQSTRLKQGAGQLDISILGQLAAAEREKLLDWVRGVGKLLGFVGAGLPVSPVQVLIVPIRGGEGPVPWGQVYRGGLGGVHFFVKADAARASFDADWTGAHEISHLLHPSLGARGAWMGEGLASYFQNVLRARAGILDQKDAWERLIAGFERGRKDPARDLALAEVAAAMRENHAFMRVYWSGAAYWLGVDVELRRRSGGKLSLDDALGRYARCCLPAADNESPEAFAATLDRQTGQDLFAAAARQAAAAPNFPDLDALYADLGIELDAERKVIGFDDQAPGAAIRRAIMARRDGPAQ